MRITGENCTYMKIMNSIKECGLISRDNGGLWNYFVQLTQNNYTIDCYTL